MDKIKILLISFLFAAFIISLPANAEFDWGGDGAKYAGDYLTGQADARLLALGGVGVAIANGPSSLLANPAMLTNRDGKGINFMHADRFSGTVRVDYLNYVLPPVDGAAMGFGLVRQGVDDIPITELENPSLPASSDNRVRVIDHSSAQEYAFLFGYGLDKSYGRIGATAKLLYKRFYENNAYGLGVDIGYARDFGRLTVGAQLRDALTTVLAWDTGRQEGIAPTARIGAAYLLQMPKQDTEILPIVEVELRGESMDDPDFAALHAGLEYRFMKVVAARVGVDDTRLAYGAGLHIGPVDLDYAFVGHDDLGNTHRVSLAYRWGY